MLDYLISTIPTAEDCREFISKNENYNATLEDLIKNQNILIEEALSRLERECHFVITLSPFTENEYIEKLKQIYSEKGFTFKSLNTFTCYLCW